MFDRLARAFGFGGSPGTSRASSAMGPSLGTTTIRSKVVLALCVLTLACLVALGMGNGEALAKARIKDIASISGARRNQLVGYGIVVGLSGTGDQKMPVTTQTTVNMLKNLGTTMQASALKLKNVASVLVTADLPAFARSGSGLDVTVSSIGDATSIQGGLLVMTPLTGADGAVYAVAQGSVVIGAGSSAAKGATRTVGRIPNGATVERDVPVTIVSKETNTFDIILSRPDFATASAVSKAIDGRYGAGVSRAASAGTVTVAVKAEWTDLVGVLSEIESMQVDVDAPAKVVVSERTGAVVMGGNTRILPVALAYGGLTVSVAAQGTASTRAGGSSGGVTGAPVALVGKEGTVADLVKLLNALGATPKDIIGVLVAMKEQGCLLADLESM